MKGSGFYLYSVYCQIKKGAVHPSSVAIGRGSCRQGLEHPFIKDLDVFIHIVSYLLFSASVCEDRCLSYLKRLDYEIQDKQVSGCL